MLPVVEDVTFGNSSDNAILALAFIPNSYKIAFGNYNCRLDAI